MPKPTTLKTLLLSIATSISFYTPAHAQDNNNQLTQKSSPLPQQITNNNLEERTLILGGNIMLGCIKSGIAAAYRNENILQNCAKGSIGGLITHIGEEIASHNKYLFVGAAGKLIHDAGTSMSDNIMRGEELFSQYQTDFGPLNFTFRSNAPPKITYTLTPLYGIAFNLYLGNKLDLKQSLYNLNLIFIDEKFSDINSTKTIEVKGYTTGNIIGYKTEIDPQTRNKVLSHEQNHALFWSKLRFTNWIGPKIELLGDISKQYDYQQDLSEFLVMIPNEIIAKGHGKAFSITENIAYSMQRE